MAIHPILIAPHPILRKKALTVHNFNQNLADLIQDMFKTMYDAPGIGLAAPQIGISKQIIVIDCAEKNIDHEFAEAQSNPIAMINPKVIHKTGQLSSYDEGCLSLPGYEISIEREETAEISFHDVKGQQQTKTLTGLEARCAMHEIDHLNGILIVDYTSQFTRSKILRSLRKK